jgi:hypothetical protein
MNGVTVSLIMLRSVVRFHLAPRLTSTFVLGALRGEPLEITDAYHTPGTYFPAVGVTAHRDGLVDGTFRRVQNLDRIVARSCGSEGHAGVNEVIGG